MPASLKEWLQLIASLVFTEGAGIVGAVFTSMSVSTWYVFLEKPEFAPQPAIFGMVWVILYALSGIALFLVWRRGTWLVDVRYGMRLFLAGVLLNVLWSVIFFGLQNIFYGLIVIGFTLIIAALTAVFFYRASKVAGLLLAPYLLWLVFAFILNYTFWILNS